MSVSRVPRTYHVRAAPVGLWTVRATAAYLQVSIRCVQAMIVDGRLLAIPRPSGARARYVEPTSAHQIAVDRIDANARPRVPQAVAK